MAVTNISKISNVLFVSVSGANPKSFFGAVGTYTVSDDNNTVRIRIAAPMIMAEDYSLNVLTELQVNGQTPTTVSQAKTLLNAIFGT
jgi:hypothetical protein